MNVLISFGRTLLLKYTCLVFILLAGITAAQAQCNPNVAIAQTGTTCLGTDTLILMGTDSVLQITWYNDTTIVSTGTDTFYVPATAGVYHAIVAAGSCADTTTGITVTALVTPSISISSTPGDSVCRNIPVAFVATTSNGGSSRLYQWTKNGNTVGTDSTYTDTIPVNGDAITAQLISNATCRTQDTAISNSITLTVFSSPSVTVSVQGSLHRCAGDSVRLTASAGNTYLWSNGDTSRIIFASIAGPYNVTVTNSHGCTVVSAPDTLTLAPTVQPAVTISSDAGDTICLNTNVTFHALSVNGGTNPQYQWKNNNINVGNTATFIGTVLHDGDVISCVLTSNATCVSPRRDTSAAITMTVHTLPVVSVSGGTVVCTSDSATLTASPANASYMWNDNETTQSITITSAGTYIVTVTDQNNCSAASTPYAVSSVSVQQAAITQSGDSLYTGSSMFYQWYYNGTIISGVTGPAALVEHSGFYQVATIDSNGCRSISAIDTIVVAGMNDLALISGMSLYPNPSTGTFTITWSDMTARDIRITDAIGSVIAEDKAITTVSKQYNLSGLASGIYYVQVSQGGLTRTIKVNVVR
ncbi:MAG: hypothetical protein JWO03_2214 [Bacteroidetes bacterium]|nr:hypothetical protein [Bacteroidota bacterium]